MSSILYAEVVGKRGDTLSLLLAEIQRGFVFEPSATLALQLLVESWELMRDGWIADELRAGQSGGLYCPFPAAEARRRAAASPIARAAPDLADEEWIADTAGRVVVATDVSDLRHAAGLHGATVAGRHRYGPTAQCEFRLRVADPGWLDHLEAGVCWDTTACPL